MMALMPQYAAVDIGSNSIRLLVAEATPNEPLPSIVRLAEDRQVVRLGESVFRDGQVSSDAMNEVVQVLSRMKSIWQRHEILGIRVVATSATRDASNREEFLARATDAIGAKIETISGQEESRLIHMGVQAIWPHPAQRVLIIDVGGGSAELIQSSGGTMAAAYSRPLGAVRLRGVFLKDDPPTEKQLRRMWEYIEDKLQPAVSRFRGKSFDRVIATSATASAIVSAVHRVARSKRDSADRMRATTPQVRQLYASLARKTLAQRRNIVGIGPRRAEIIVPGVAVFLAIFDSLKLPSFHFCSSGVRDGIVADLALRRVGRERSRLNSEQRAVIEALARRYGVDPHHGRRLGDFAQALFDATTSLHRLPPYFGKLLEAAAYLCDVGHYISDTSHHKHSQYIVQNSDLAGFTDSERQLIGLLCRYHRKAMPNPRHAEFQGLPPEARQSMMHLIPLLRLTDGMDHSGDQRVSQVSCRIDASSVEVTLHSAGDLNLEEWALEQVAEPFRAVYSRQLLVRVAPAR